MESNFDHEYDLLKKELDRAEALQKNGYGLNAASASANTITVNAGGIGIWVCATFCALCLLTSFFVLWIVSDIRQNDRDQGNQLNAIYMMAPHLKPEKTK
jgi:hypothetical protein